MADEPNSLHARHTAVRWDTNNPQPRYIPDPEHKAAHIPEQAAGAHNT
jgi:hypothetical protein